MTTTTTTDSPATGALPQELLSISLAPEEYSNWAQSFSCVPSNVFRPRDVQDIIKVLRWCKRYGKELRVKGQGHSPSDLGMVRSTQSWVKEGEGKEGGVLLDMSLFSRFLSQDQASATVTVESGMSIFTLSQHLSTLSPPMALSCLGSISAQTIAGAISTATHGAGWNYGSLSSYVTSLTLLIPATLSLLTCTPTVHSDIFWSATCGLGCIGIIISIELKVEPEFNLMEELWEMKFPDFLKEFEKVLKSGQHARQFWFPHISLVKCSRLNRTNLPSTPSSSSIQKLYRNLLSKFNETSLLFSKPFPSILRYHAMALYHLQHSHLPVYRPTSSHSTDGQSFDYSTSVSPVHRIAPSLQVFNYDIGSPQYTYEGAVPLNLAVPFLRAMDVWLRTEMGGHHHFPIEIRVVDSDKAWLSPTYGGRRVYIGMVQYKPFKLDIQHRKLFKGFERLLLRFEGRPHWAKEHGCTPEVLMERYEMWERFKEVREQVDPEGVLCNAYVRRHVLGVEEQEEGQKMLKAKL